MSYASIVAEILDREGWPAYTNRPEDRGGPTKGGITLDSWRGFTRNPDATAEELQQVTEQQARAFYTKRYIVDPRFDDIVDEELTELIVDAGVLHGTYRASRWLQKCAGVNADGQVGPITLAAVNAQPAAALVLEVCALRFELFGRLVSADPELKRARAAGFKLQAIFALGWNRRGAEFLLAQARQIRDAVAG